MRYSEAPSALPAAQYGLRATGLRHEIRYTWRRRQRAAANAMAEQRLALYRRTFFGV